MAFAYNRKVALHWLIVLVLIWVGLYIGKWLDNKEMWITIRYRLFQALQVTNIRQPAPTRTRLVLIGDEEYWKGDLARRVPIKRDYLARLLLALDRADPAVIVLDFDLRSPMQDGSLVDNNDYLLEDQALIAAIAQVSQKRPIILPTSINVGADDQYYEELTIYGRAIFSDGWVTRGYIELPYDLRAIPMPLHLRNNQVIDSLASAVVKYDNSMLHREIVKKATENEESVPFGSFISASAFPAYTATYILTADPRLVKPELSHKVVLIGAEWSRFAYKRGGAIDATMTPVGVMGKVFLHANYIEALLDRRTISSPGEWMTGSIEVLFALVLAWFFSRKFNALTKVIIFLGLAVSMTIITYILLQNAGIYFDFFIPLVLLGGHAGVEQIIEWRNAAYER